MWTAMMISRNRSPSNRDKVSSDVYNIIRSFSWEHPDDPMTRTNLRWRFTEALQLLHQEQRMNPVKRDYVLDQIDGLLRPRFLHRPGWRVIAVFRECVESWCNRQMALAQQQRDCAEEGQTSEGKEGRHGEAPKGRANKDGAACSHEAALRDEDLRKMDKVFEDIEAEEASRRKMKLTNLIT
ncbi:uncharacterized protein J7T54_005322 [Emericellopsis cladophorae]|uniref:Uncharacterized protein n=1 Tax=Emericellopsis cladophorae TaxID=2686198 RepID=A0A9Q0BE90_9HYPO|nr:uncharacterized protein J7T54_005322 [Emericellopsis cladophorae]KAI6781611.1 hypothetical protein J7T54_005322 [Emericellopsis cladophorae]